ncbi:dTDP-4-dehydrorhamnose 3,5-epimerase [Myroides sp. LJL119]
MKVSKSFISGVLVLQPTIFYDDRGYFTESYNQDTFAKATGLNINFVQDNQSFSTYGVLRGLHFQTGDFQQAKLVRVTQGKVLDIAVDLRGDSPTYGRYIKQVLDDKSHEQLFIPRGFAHGFVVLSPTATFTYKCDNYYNKESEGGIIYNDKDLQIDWEINPKDIVVSEKDLLLPGFKDTQSL